MARRTDAGGRRCGGHYDPRIRRAWRCTTNDERSDYDRVRAGGVSADDCEPEEDPLQPTVITVGSFHAGTKHNIIPDEAHLQLTVRTMTPEQRAKTLAAITQAANGIAAAAGVPADHAPIITISKDGVPATINDPALTRRMAAAMEKELGKENVFRDSRSWPARISVCSR